MLRSRPYRETMKPQNTNTGSKPPESRRNCRTPSSASIELARKALERMSPEQAKLVGRAIHKTLMAGKPVVVTQPKPKAT